MLIKYENKGLIKYILFMAIPALAYVLLYKSSTLFTVRLNGGLVLASICYVSLYFLSRNIDIRWNLSKLNTYNNFEITYDFSKRLVVIRTDNSEIVLRNILHVYNKLVLTPVWCVKSHTIYIPIDYDINVINYPKRQDS